MPFRCHDHDCSGYRFSGTELILELTCPDFPQWGDLAGRRCDITFHGVLCHHLESVQQSNTIFDIVETTVALVEADYAHVFAHLKNQGWPRLEKDDASLTDLVSRNGLTVYEISSSYGMTGFVVAHSASQENGSALP